MLQRLRQLILTVLLLGLGSDCCPPPTVVKVPVVVKPPTCFTLIGEPPAPPATEIDAEWVRYHVDVEVWIAKASKACR